MKQTYEEPANTLFVFVFVVFSFFRHLTLVLTRTVSSKYQKSHSICAVHTMPSEISSLQILKRWSSAPSAYITSFVSSTGSVLKAKSYLSPSRPVLLAVQCRLLQTLLSLLLTMMHVLQLRQIRCLHPYLWWIFIGFDSFLLHRTDDNPLCYFVPHCCELVVLDHVDLRLIFFLFPF